MKSTCVYRKFIGREFCPLNHCESTPSTYGFSDFLLDLFMYGVRNV